MGKTNESCSKCVFDRLPPEMTRFIIRKLSTEDLLQASVTTDRLYRVAQHHLYLSDGALLVRGGQDTTTTVAGMLNVRNVVSLYLVDVYDFDRDVSRHLRRRGNDKGRDHGDSEGDANDDGGGGDRFDDDINSRVASVLDVLHVGYAQNVWYAELPADGMRRLLSDVRAKRVCFSNVLMTADDVADVVSLLLRPGENEPPVLRCSYDRVEDVQVLELLDRVQSTCAGLLSEFRVTIRRPAPRSYAVYPMSCAENAVNVNETEGGGHDDRDGDREDDENAVASVAAELPEDLLVFNAADGSGLTPVVYKRLGAACRQLRRVCVKAARQVDDDGFEALAGMPSLQHLDMDGMCNVTSDGLLNGLDKARSIQSLGLSECPYVTDDVLHRVGKLRRLRRLRLDLTVCDKTTAAGVTNMLSGCERVQELELTVPLNADYVDAVAQAASLGQLREFRLTFERLSFQDHLDNQPADGDWQRALATRFRDDVQLHVQQIFTKITVSVG